MPFDSINQNSASLSEQLMASIRERRQMSATPRLDGETRDVEAQDPRIVTRGSFSAKPLKTHRKSERPSASSAELSGLLDELFFDWYQVTLPNAEGGASCIVGSSEEQSAVDAAFRWARDNGLHPGQIGGGHNGYRAALPFTNGATSKESVFRVNAGSTSGVMPNLMLTGGHGACAELAPRLQEAFPGARLSRADVALDWSQEGLWDDLLRMARLLCNGNKKLGGVRTIESDTGRTFYLGAKSSSVSLRVYEKDRERAARGVIDAADIDPNLIRIEWTFKPQSRSKAGMAKLSPSQLVRTSVWARDFMARAAKIMSVTGRVERINKQEVAREVREKTLEGTVEHGVSQYAKSFARLAAARIVERDHGGHYDTAMIEPQAVEVEAVAIFRELLSHTDAAAAAVMDARLDRVMDPDEWRSSYVHELIEAPASIREGIAKAQAQMAVRAAALGFLRENEAGGGV